MAPVIFLISVLILVGIGFAFEQADSFEAEQADSLQAESPDSLLAGEPDSLLSDGHDEYGEDKQEVAAPRRGKPLSQDPGSWLWDTHPKYDVEISKRKDVTNWDAKISLQRRISEKLSLNLNGSLHTRENSTLNRSDSNDRTSANLKYKLNDNINFGLAYNASVNAYRFGLTGGEPQDRKRKQDLTVSSELSKEISDAIEVTLKTVAGSTENSFADVRNRGSKQDLSASISYSPDDDIKASANYNARRMLLDSAVDSGGVSVFTSEDRTFSQNLSMSVTYNIVPGVKIDFDAGRTNQEKQHPEPKQKKQETETTSSKRAGIRSAFNVLERLTWDVSVDFSDSEREFELQTGKNNAITKSSLSASAKLQAWRGAKFNLGGSREITRSEYTTANTGDDVHKSLSLKLSQDLGPKADLSLAALSDMVSVFYDDKVATPKDRDRLSNRVTIDVNYTPHEKITTKLGGEFSEEQSVYIKAASSASNRTTRKYRVSGRYRVKTVRKIDITQDYDISAVYTYYHYGDSQNTLVRNSSVRTRFGIPIARGFRVDLNHNYKFQDQGSYREESGRRLYGRSAESESHVFSIGCNYRLGQYFKIAVNQSYYLQQSWDYDDGEKTLDYERVTTEISGKMTFKYDIGERTKVSLSVQQNEKDGTAVNEAFKSYRNVELEASHVF